MERLPEASSNSARLRHKSAVWPVLSEEIARVLADVLRCIKQSSHCAAHISRYMTPAVIQRYVVPQDHPPECAAGVRRILLSNDLD